MPDMHTLITNGTMIFGTYLFMYFVIYKILKYCNAEFWNLSKFENEFNVERSKGISLENSKKNKRLYIVKNYVKSLVLGIFCYRAVYQAYVILFAIDSFDIFDLQLNTLAYVFTDTIGLLIVPNLPINTKLHHITTNLLGVYVLSATYSNVCSSFLPVLYASFSALSFIVNFYLAYRCHSMSEENKKILSKISYWVYASTSVMNWFVQIYYMIVVFINGEYVFPTMYIACLYTIIKDDIILMRWLKNDFETKNK